MRRLLAAVVVLGALLAAPVDALADSFTLPHATVTTRLERSGAIEVTEQIEFSFSGYFSGAYRDIPLPASAGVSDVWVAEGARRYAPGALTSLGSSGTDGSFGAVRIPYQGLRVVWHYQASNERRTFTVHYRLTGVVRRHPDVVDIQQQVWGDQWKQSLGSLDARLILPGQAPSGATYRSWVDPAFREHALTQRPDGVIASATDVPPGSAVTLRTLVPSSLLDPAAPDAVRVATPGLPQIAKDEDAQVAEYRKQQSQLDQVRHHPFAWLAAALALALVPAALIAGLVFRVYGRERPTGTKPQYLTEPPDELAPALVPSLLAQRTVTSRELLAATLFDLIRRGRYRTSGQTTTEGRREIDDVELSAGPAKDLELSPVDQPVAAIFDRLLEHGPFKLSEASSIVGGLGEADRRWYNEQSRRFDAAVVGDVTGRAWWRGPGYGLKFLVVLAFAVAGALLLWWGIRDLIAPPLTRGELIRTGLGIALLINAAICLALPISVWRRRVPQAQADAERWEAFHDYLRDFPRLDEKPADTIVLWERYLVYGIAFGLADRVMAAAKVGFPAVAQSGVYSGMSSGFYAGSVANAFAFPAPASQSSGGGSFGGGGGGGGGGSFGGGGGGAW